MTSQQPQTSAALHSIASTEPGEQLLALCKAGGDALRLNILRVLSKDSFGVLELCQILDCKQSGMSHHLKILAKAGLVTTRREGNTIFYRRAPQAGTPLMEELQRALFRNIDQLSLQTIQSRLDAVQAERAEHSKAFFAENANKFQQQQEQVADYALYGSHALELLGRSVIDNSGKALEVGPGEGAFLKELSPRFQQVYALDNSDAMLEKARATVAELRNVHFIHGDTKNAELHRHRFDCVVVNMVLHHIPSPADIFQDISDVLKTGGQLLITDLCHHDQNWVREACGDLWLGFEPEDVEQWAQDAGLQEKESTYLAQRNGFRVQVRQFEKI